MNLKTLILSSFLLVGCVSKPPLPGSCEEQLALSQTREQKIRSLLEEAEMDLSSCIEQLRRCEAFPKCP